MGALPAAGGSRLSFGALPCELKACSPMLPSVNETEFSIFSGINEIFSMLQDELVNPNPWSLACLQSWKFGRNKSSEQH